MEVTKDNFSVVFPSLEEEFERCDFFTFDLEMTGINLHPDDQKQGSPEYEGKGPGSFLTAPVDDCIYQNKDTAARKFSIIQMGLSIFTKEGEVEFDSEEKKASNIVFEDSSSEEEEVDDEEEEEEVYHRGGKKKQGVKKQVVKKVEFPNKKRTYSHKSFNFYLFPAFTAGQIGAGCKKRVILDCETVGGFLTEHGMDFSKWISKGIPYVTAEEAAVLRNKSGPKIEDYDDLANKDPTFRGFLNKAKALAATRNSTETFEFPFFTSMNVMKEAEKCCRLLGLKKISFEGPGGKRRYQIAVNPDHDPEQNKHSQERALGAYRLYELMSKSRKPLVAHNCLSDLLFLFHAFHSTPPTDYRDFKRQLNKDFPIIFDTRCLATLPRMGFDIDCLSNLGGQYRYFGEKTRKWLDFKHLLGFDHFHPKVLQFSPRGAHEAAYDAYMTGCLFLALQLKLSGNMDFDSSVMQYANHIAVFGSIITCRLGKTDSKTGNPPEDVCLNTAAVLYIQNPPGSGGSREAGMNAKQLDACFKGSDLRGRGMTTVGGSVVFCGYNSGYPGCKAGPQSAEEFTKALERVQGYIEKSNPGSRAWVIFDPTGIVPKNLLPGSKAQLAAVKGTTHQSSSSSTAPPPGVF